MDDWHEVSKTNDKNHTARRTHGDFTLPIAGNFDINCTKMLNSGVTLTTKSYIAKFAVSKQKRVQD